MNPYLIGGSVALIVLLGWLLKGSYERAGELEAKLATQALEAEEAANANLTNQTTITRLQSRIEELVAQRRADAAERERLLLERDDTLRRLRIENDRLREEREDEITENEDCAELSALRVSDFCPAAGQQLRLRSGSPGSHGDQDSR